MYRWQRMSLGPVIANGRPLRPPPAPPGVSRLIINASGRPSSAARRRCPHADLGAALAPHRPAEAVIAAMNALRPDILNEDRVAVKGRPAIHPEHLTALIVPVAKVCCGSLPAAT